MTFLCMGAFCMGLASLYIPVIVLKARKFVLLFSLGSLFFIFSFSLLWGVKNHLKHLANPARLPFTLSYFLTLFATIYYAMIVSISFFNSKKNVGTRTYCTVCQQFFLCHSIKFLFFPIQRSKVLYLR
jgi:hypothetical protein